MRRLFISLFLMIAASLFVFIHTVPLLIEHSLKGPLIGSASSYAETPRALFELELAKVPREQWPAYVESLTPEFGYGLELLTLSGITTSETVLSRLRKGEVSIEPDDNYEDIAYFPMRGTDYVIRVPFAQSQSEHAQRSVDGFYYLLDRQLASLSSVERASFLAKLNATVTIPIAERELADIDFNLAERERLQAGLIVGRDLDDNDETYFKAVKGTNKVMVIGPIGSSFVLDNMEWFALGLLGLFFAGGAFLWLRPMVRDMQALDGGAVAFGDGNLNARVDVSKRSRIRELAASFNAMAERIKALIGAQKELTDSVSHELRTPIARLRFGMHRLENSNSHGEWEQAMDGMRQDVDELDLLVDELLTYSRMQNLESRLVSGEVQVEPWLARIAEDNAAENEKITVTSRVDSGINTLTFDRRLMSRAIGNLVQNAIRYAHSHVSVSAERVANGVAFVVADDGDGIAAEDMARIFEPFTRLGNNRKGESRGYGLGLSIVKQICDWHDATIVVETSSTGGAKFVITLR